MGLLFQFVLGVLCAVLIWAVVWLVLRARIGTKGVQNIEGDTLDRIKTEAQITATLFVALSGAVALFSFTQESGIATEARLLEIGIAEAEQFAKASEFLTQDDGKSTEAAISVLRRLVAAHPETHATGAARIAKSAIEIRQLNLPIINLTAEHSARRNEIFSLVELYTHAAEAKIELTCESQPSDCASHIDLSFLRLGKFYGRLLDGKTVTFSNDLTGTYAYLPYADFSRITLKRAIFSNATLTEAQFVESTLLNSEFRTAELTGARFIGAKMQHANFTGATMIDTALVGADLSCASLQASDLSESVPDLVTLTPALIFSETILPAITDRTELMRLRSVHFGEDLGIYNSCTEDN